MPGEQAWRWLRRWFDGQLEAMLALGALVTFALLLTLVQFSRLGERFQEDIQTQAHILASTASAAVVFDNAKDAAEILSAFQRSSAVQSAELVGLDNKLIARYAVPVSQPDALHRLAGELAIGVPVLAGGERVGHLMVRANRAGVWMDLIRFVGVATGLLVMALALAWVASHRLRADVRAAERRTRFLAHYDALTELPNRESFRLALERAMALAAHHQDPRTQALAVLIIDLDNFKKINDFHGHAAGDTLLRAVAQRLSSVMRPGDLAARLAGDEFALLMAGPLYEGRALHVAEQLVKLIPQPVDHEGSWLRVSVSVGVSLAPRDALSVTEAMQCADAAMYQAKRLGKDGLQLFSTALGDAHRARLSLEQDLRLALSVGETELAYQPLFDRDGKLVSLEALSRWRHASRGWVSPAEFIPVAESSGLIVELGLHALQVLRRDMDACQAAGLSCPQVALNLSSRQCLRTLHREKFLNALTRLQLGPGSLEFELTESSVFEDLDSPDSIVLTLQGLGYALSIDDFGTGYSSLAYLRRMRCRKLKIDRLFIHGLAASADSRMLVDSMIRVAHSMHMLVVAEGVEREADLQCLIDMGCDLFQGFGLSRPLQPAQVKDLLLRQARGERARVQDWQPWYDDRAQQPALAGPN